MKKSMHILGTIFGVVAGLALTASGIAGYVLGLVELSNGIELYREKAKGGIRNVILGIVSILSGLLTMFIGFSAYIEFGDELVEKLHRAYVEKKLAKHNLEPSKDDDEKPDEEKDADEMGFEW